MFVQHPCLDICLMPKMDIYAISEVDVCGTSRFGYLNKARGGCLCNIRVWIFVQCLGVNIYATSKFEHLCNINNGFLKWMFMQH